MIAVVQSHYSHLIQYIITPYTIPSFITPKNPESRERNNRSKMAHLTPLTLLLLLIAFVSAGVRAGNTFVDENPIKQVVSDGLREFESSVLKVLGNTRHALSFARFAHRFITVFVLLSEFKFCI